MNALIAFALKQRVFLAVLLPFVLAAGVAGFRYLNIEAYPDPVPPLVDIVTQSTGLSAEEIERYITIPIEVQMAGIPNVTTVRTASLFGLSDVKVQFTYAFTYEQAEQWVINRLSQLPALPNGAQPAISAVSPIGEIYRYRVLGPPGYSVTDLKTLQDWIIQRRFKAVPGVIDVTGWGGQTKTFEVTVDQNRLAQYGLSLAQILQALNNSNVNVGGQTLNIGPQSAVVRGVGLIHSIDDIRRTMVASSRGAAVLIEDVATVSVGHEPRLGIAGHDGDDDIVQGTVLMRRGSQSMPTIERVHEEVENINRSGILPPGVRIERIYDRSDLIKVTTGTVLHNVIAGVALIFLLQWAFLGNLRSALIVACTIPFAFTFAIALMTLRGESANLLSVGAIDFGLIVDATVIMVENIFRHLSETAEARRTGGALLHVVRDSGVFRGKFAVIANAATEVNRAILFAAAIIIAGFVPLFTLSGIEGHIFGPMARTYGYAITGGLIATFTIAPALSALLLPDSVAETETMLVRSLRRLYEPVMEFALANKVITLGGFAVLLAVALFAGRSLGLEFLPKLEEGNLWIRASMPDSISLEEGNGYVNRMRRLIGSFPEVQTIVSQHGRPDDGTDATGFFNAEFFVPLQPPSDWPKGVDKEALTAQMTAALEKQFPGVEFAFSQYIQDNVEEYASGVKGENSVKIYGNDLETLESTANKIRAVLEKVPGITDLSVLNSLGQPTVRIDIDRSRAARLGLAPGDINATIQAAIGGRSAGDLYESGSDRHFPMIVRLAERYRGSPAAIGFVALFGIATMDGIIVLSYYNLHIEQGLDRVSAMLHTCRVQMRPVMMTCVVACVGLVPAAVSTGIGSQVQRPLALVVVGGMLLTPILVLLVLPVLILLVSRRQPTSEQAALPEPAR